MTLKDLMNVKEWEENPPLTDQELTRFLWEVREQRNVFAVKRSLILRLFSTLVEKEDFSTQDTETDGLVCQDCGTTEGVEKTTCPYAADIGGEEVEVVLCYDCLHERAMNI